MFIHDQLRIDAQVTLGLGMVRCCCKHNSWVTEEGFYDEATAGGDKQKIFSLASDEQGKLVLMTGSPTNTPDGGPGYRIPDEVRYNTQKCVKGSLVMTKMLDAGGKHVYPGMVAAVSTIGLIEVGQVPASRDEREIGVVTSGMPRAIASRILILMPPPSKAGPAEQAAQARQAATLLGPAVETSVTADGLRINDSLVVAADIQTANGVIHVIDAVILPPEPEEMNLRYFSKTSRKANMPGWSPAEL